MRNLVVVAIVTLVAVAPAEAQNSVYGVVGIGFPGDPLSARARAMGGGSGVFDAYSALNPATVVGLGDRPRELGRLAAGGTAGTTLRQYAAGDSTVSGLRETRFPFGFFGGLIPGTRFSFALSFSTYAERTYDVTTTGTQVLRGDTLEVTDRVASEGSVTDFRGAIGFRPWRPLLVGASFHLLGGSSRLIVGRTFSVTDYSPYVERAQLAFSGTGVSAGVVLVPTSAIALGASVRVDGELTIKNGNADEGAVPLPLSLAGGVSLTPVAGVTLASTVVRRSWSRAQPDLLAPSRAFDTWEIGSGLEISRPSAGATLPIRVGYRYRELPFSNVATQPTERVITGGTGIAFSGGRAGLDASVERFHRSGGGADERGWYFSLGVVIIP